MNILIVDNYDSFTYNLFHYVQQFTEDVSVITNDKINLKDIDNFEKIILSPGPGLPDEHNNLKSIIHKYDNRKSILGICLGHQAIAEFYNTKLKNLDQVMHGVVSDIEIFSNDSIFQDIPRKIKVGHYHSWVIDEGTLPSTLNVTSRNQDGIIMSIKHNKYDVIGLQFHPESILTEYGLKIIENWIKN